MHYTHPSASVPDWAHGEVRVVRSPPVQHDRSGVPAPDEDVGAALDEGHRRAWYHLHSHAVVTVHHASNHLNLEGNDRYFQSSHTHNCKEIPAPSPRTNASVTHLGSGSVGVITQDVAGQYQALSVCVYEGQREVPSCRVKQGPGVSKAS